MRGYPRSALDAFGQTPLSPAAALAKVLGTLCHHCGRMNWWWRVATLPPEREPRCYYCDETLDLAFEFGNHMYEAAVRGAFRGTGNPTTGVRYIDRD